MNSNKPVFLVEDDQIDRMTIERTFKSLGVKNILKTAINGQEGLKALHESSEPPCLIILDINMPKMNGIEFLRIVKANEEYKKIPVVILTTSNDDKDKNTCYSFGVAGYIIKPIDYREFQDVIKTLNNYWNINQFTS